MSLIKTIKKVLKNLIVQISIDNSIPHVTQRALKKNKHPNKTNPKYEHKADTYTSHGPNNFKSTPAKQLRYRGLGQPARKCNIMSAATSIACATHAHAHRHTHTHERKRECKQQMFGKVQGLKVVCAVQKLSSAKAV